MTNSTNLEPLESEELLQDNENAASEQVAFEGFPYNSNFLELSNGLNMHYLDEGSGDPIVLLHGQPTSSFLWRNIIPELADNARVIVPDLINFGLSDKTEEPLEVIEDHGALFSEFIDTLGLEDITFIGHDWGGPIELTYAVDNPDNVKALAFFESAIVPLPDVSVVGAFPEQFVQAFWSDPDLLEQNAIEKNLFIEGWLFDPAFGGIANPLTEAEKEVYREPFLDPEARDQLAIAPTQLPLLDPTGFPILDPDGPGGLPAEQVAGIEEYIEFASYLATTEVPKLLIYGNPGFASPELVLPLAESIPGFEIQEIGDADNPVFHFIQEDAPEELSDILGEWYDTSVALPEPEPPSETTTLQVTVENLAPENGIGFVQLWFGLHDGSFDFFNQGEPASKTLEFLAEDGLIGLEEIILPGILEETVAAGLDINQLPLSVQEAIALGLDLSNIPPPPGTLAGDFLLSSAGINGGTQGMVVTDIRTNPELFDLLDDPSAFPQEVLDSVENPFFFVQASGETETFTVTLNGTPEENRYFSFASMLFPTNDGFIGNDNPQAIEIFDESGNFVGADFVVTGEDAWDGGTEVNDESPSNLAYTFEAFGKGVDENGTIQPFPGFLASGEGGILDFEFNGNLVAENADFTVLDYPIARITVTEVTEPTEPETTLEDVIDLTNLGDRSVTIAITRDAGFNNTVDFYEINADGSVTDETGTTIALGEAGYQEAAIANRLGLDLATENQQTTEFDAVLEGDKIYAPLIAINSTFAPLTDSDTSNDPLVFFAFEEANVDDFDHIRRSGDNRFEFEDLFGGGDSDYNDIVVEISGLNLTEEPEPEPEPEPDFGTTGADIIEVIGSNQLIFAGDGNDLIDASRSEGNNRIFGGSGDDSFILGAGDVLSGGAGEDSFFNQAGKDNQVTGGADADRFWIAAAEIPEVALTITDFELDIDVIGVGGIGASSTADLSFSQDGNDAIISFDGTDLATLQGIDTSDLEQNGNFIFS